ncbi:MAG: WD40 repeat domain-containing protein [Planctomycetes bacterium]|nr:WD40 repeat domain-containing protein [Planctomycetota bacterium]
MRCGRCQNSPPEDSLFCPRCGQDLRAPALAPRPQLLFGKLDVQELGCMVLDALGGTSAGWDDPRIEMLLEQVAQGRVAFLPTRRCDRCGYRSLLDARHCGGCGAALPAVKLKPPSGATASPSMTAAPPVSALRETAQEAAPPHGSPPAAGAAQSAAPPPAAPPVPAATPLPAAGAEAAALAGRSVETKEALLGLAHLLLSMERWDDLVTTCEEFLKTRGSERDPEIDALIAKARYQQTLKKARELEGLRDWNKAQDAYAACMTFAPGEEKKTIEERVLYCRRKKMFSTNVAAALPGTPRPSSLPTPTTRPAPGGTQGAPAPAGAGASSAPPPAGVAGAPADRPRDTGVLLRASFLSKEIPFSTALYAFAFHPGDGKIAAVCEDSQVAVFSVPTGAPVRALEVKGPMRSVAFSVDGRLLAAGGEDGVVWVWSTTNWECMARIDAHEGRVLYVAFSPDAWGLLTAGIDGLVKFWRLASPGAPLANFRESKSNLSHLRLSADGKLLATAREDHAIRLLDYGAGTTLATLTGHKDKIAALACSPNGKLLASASWDRTVALWDLKTRARWKELGGMSGGALAVAFSADSRCVAAAGWDRHIRVWELDTSQPPADLVGHQARVTWIGFLPDGHTLLSSADDGSLRLWSVPDRKELEAIRGKDRGHGPCEFTADGRFLVAQTSENKIAIFALKRRS